MSKYCKAWKIAKFNAFSVTFSLPSGRLFIRELQQRQRRRPGRQKTIIFMIKTTALHVHLAFQYISLTSSAQLRRITPIGDVLSRTWANDNERTSTNVPLSFSTWMKSLRIHSSRHWQVPIDSTKFETTQIRCLATLSLPSSPCIGELKQRRRRRQRERQKSDRFRLTKQ